MVIEIYNTTGRRLISEKHKGIISEINLDAFSTGIYYIKVITSNSVVTRKITTLYANSTLLK